MYQYYGQEYQGYQKFVTNNENFGKNFKCMQKLASQGSFVAGIHSGSSSIVKVAIMG